SRKLHAFRSTFASKQLKVTACAESLEDFLRGKRTDLTLLSPTGGFRSRLGSTSCRFLVPGQSETASGGHELVKMASQQPVDCGVEDADAATSNVYLSGDPYRLKQVLANLLSNGSLCSAAPQCHYDH